MADKRSSSKRKQNSDENLFSSKKRMKIDQPLVCNICGQKNNLYKTLLTCGSCINLVHDGDVKVKSKVLELVVERCNDATKSLLLDLIFTKITLREFLESDLDELLERLGEQDLEILE